MLHVFHRLAEHLRWADALILDALRQTASPPAKALEIYGHVLGAEHVWLARIHGRTSEFGVWPPLEVDACADLAARNAAELESLVRASTAESLGRSVHYRNSAGVEFDSKVEDILLHVGMHGQYHRGQVNLLLREAGLQPSPVDFIAFTRGQAAATRKP